MFAVRVRDHPGRVHESLIALLPALPAAEVTGQAGSAPAVRGTSGAQPLRVGESPCFHKLSGS